MLWTLDPHSAFFTRDELRKLYEEQSSQFYGIGVSILQHRDGVYVQSVIPKTPADKGGLRYGDRFIEVDGKDATEWTSAEVSKNVRGERGTTVNVKIERAGMEKPVEMYHRPRRRSASLDPQLFYAARTVSAMSV